MHLHRALDVDGSTFTMPDTEENHIVGHRSDQVEPRVKKRRPKPCREMTKLRRNYKNRVL